MHFFSGTDVSLQTTFLMTTCQQMTIYQMQATTVVSKNATNFNQSTSSGIGKYFLRRAILRTSFLQGAVYITYVIPIIALKTLTKSFTLASTKWR